MSNVYTKEQIENGTLNAQELLNSFSVGNNAATKTPSLTKGIHNGAIQGVPVSTALLTAVVEFFCAKSPEQLAAVQAGYIVPRHKMQYENTKTGKPLEGHYLTSEQYLESCFAMLPELATPTFEDIQAKLASYKQSMNKTELVAIIEEIIQLCTPRGYTSHDLTAEQFAKYTDLRIKEEALATATRVLSMYMDNIVPVKGSDTSIQGKFYPERGQGNELVQLLDQEGWKILVSTPVPAKLDSNFAVTEPGYILMSVQVVKAEV